MKININIKNTFVSIIITILSATITFASTTTTYQYDNLHRLIRVERSDGAVIAYTYDNLGNRLSKIVTPPISAGDINGDGQTSLSDVILSLQVATGINSTTNINLASDVNNDGKIGIEETIYMMQVVSGLGGE